MLCGLCRGVGIPGGASGRDGGAPVPAPIGETGLTDLAGPYPMLSCADWGALGAAVAGLEPGR